MWRSFSGSSSSPTAVAPPRDSEKADECDLALAPRAGETQTRREGTEENQEPRPNIDEPPLETGASPFRAETAKVPPATVTSAYARHQEDGRELTAAQRWLCVQSRCP